MKKNLFVILFGIICLIGTQQIAFGQSQTAPGTILSLGDTFPSTNQTPKKTDGDTFPATATGTATENPKKLDDPLGESTTIEGLLLSLFDIVFYIGVPVVAFFLIWSGFMFIAAQGNEGKLETAKSRLVWTIVGAILLLGAWTISQAIKGTIINIKKGATSYLSTHTFS